MTFLQDKRNILISHKNIRDSMSSHNQSVIFEFLLTKVIENFIEIYNDC